MLEEYLTRVGQVLVKYLSIQVLGKYLTQVRLLRESICATRL